MVCVCFGANVISVLLFVQLISQNQQEFIAMLNEGVQGGGEAGQGDGGAMAQGGPMDQGSLGGQGHTTIQVTPQEKEAIDRVRNDERAVEVYT